MTSRETWNATGSGNVNDSSSGICTSGIQGNYSNNFSSSYFFTGSANASGNYSIHEEGAYGNGTYNLGTVTYSVSGGANNSEGYNGGDSITGSAPGAQYTMSDSYNGSANGNTNYSLSESGQYAGGVWTISQFTEAETTVTSANYTGSGNFSSSGPSGNESGNYQYTSASSSNFSLYGVGQYANGSFSFQSFSASLAAQAGTTFTESASGPNFSYNRTDATAHSLNLGETGHNQIGNYTLTVTDSDYHSFTETINGATTSYTSSSSISCTTYGTFSLAGGNPYLPYGGNVGQAGGAGVGIQTPWYSRTTGASEGGTNGQGAGSNRVTNSLPRIQGERLEPQWGSGVPMQGEGLPPATSDDPNLGLPVGPNGTGGSAITPLSFSPQFQDAGKVPALIPPQPSPNNGPYKNSLKSYAEDCFCAGIVSVGYAPYLLGGGGGFLVAIGGDSTFADGQTGGQDVKTDIDKALEKFKSLPEAKKLLEDAAKKLGIKEVRIKLIDEQQQKRIGLAGLQTGYFEIGANIIWLQPNLELDEAITTILSEVTRAYYAKDKETFYKEAFEGKYGRNEYAVKEEEWSYKSVKLFKQIVEKGIKGKVWSAETDPEPGPVPSLEEFLKKKDKPLPGGDPDDTHTGFYRKQWDRVFKKAYEKRQKEKKMGFLCLPWIPPWV
jgi:hypothetical protein